MRVEVQPSQSQPNYIIWQCTEECMKLEVSRRPQLTMHKPEAPLQLALLYGCLQRPSMRHVHLPTCSGWQCPRLLVIWQSSHGLQPSFQSSPQFDSQAMPMHQKAERCCACSADKSIVLKSRPPIPLRLYPSPGKPLLQVEGSEGVAVPH